MTEAPAFGRWEPIEEASADDDMFVGGFFNAWGWYDRPRIVRAREKTWPRRLEFYDGPQRVFPTHFMRLPTSLPPAPEVTNG